MIFSFDLFYISRTRLLQKLFELKIPIEWICILELRLNFFSEKYHRNPNDPRRKSSKHPTNLQ